MPLEMTKNLKNASLPMLSGFLDSNFCIRNDLGAIISMYISTHLLLLQIAGLFKGDLGPILLTSSVIYMYTYQTKM